jgi:hypothetical protein
LISFIIDKASVSTGDVLTAQILWNADGDRGARRIIVAAEWHTEGKGNRATGVGRGTTFVPEKGARRARFPVRFLIPHEGPISFKGELIHLRWMLRVRVDQFGLDETAEAEFKVEPRRRKR